MAPPHIFLGIIPFDIVKHFFRPMRGVSGIAAKVFSDLGPSLQKANMEIDPEDYLTAGMVSYAVLAGTFGLFLYWLATVKGKPLNEAVGYGMAAGFGIFMLLLILLVRMPRVQAKGRSADVDKYLLYALRDVALQVSAGTPLYDTLKQVAQSKYGIVSEEFERVVREVNVGMPMRQALEEMAARTDSEYLRKTAWQMINSLRAGADLRKTLESLVKELDEAQKTKIMSYARELNLWSLVYMLFAVAIPTIGSTMMVILSTFAGFGITKNLFILFIVVCFFIQIGLVSFVKMRRPVVEF